MSNLDRYTVEPVKKSHPTLRNILCASLLLTHQARVFCLISLFLATTLRDSSMQKSSGLTFCVVCPSRRKILAASPRPSPKLFGHNCFQRWQWRLRDRFNFPPAPCPDTCLTNSDPNCHSTSAPATISSPSKIPAATH